MPLASSRPQTNKEPAVIARITLLHPWHDLPVGLQVTINANTASELVDKGWARFS